MRLRERLANRHTAQLILTLFTMLLLLTAIGALLNIRVNTLLNRYMEGQGSKQAETLAELTKRQFEKELTALYTVASELPWIDGMRDSALQAIQRVDRVGKIGVLRIDGSPFFGERYGVEEFPCIDSAVHGESAISYCPGRGLMFCVPAFRDGNIAYIVYRLYPEQVLFQQFGVASYGGKGHARIEDAEGRTVVDMRPDGELEASIFEEESVQSGLRFLTNRIYENGSACAFRRASLGKVMLYGAVIEGIDYRVIGYVPKSVVMEGVQYISYLVILVFAVLSAVLLLGGFLLFRLERQSRERDALREAARVAEKSSAVKSAFLANMSHDIRTPMNAIMGFTRLLRQNSENRELALEYVGKIESASSNLLDLINGILEMSRLDSGNLELNETVCSLPDTLKELEEIISGQVREKRQTYISDCSLLAHRMVWCDHTQLHRALLNLVGNAVKFTPEGGNISVRVTESEGSRPDTARYELRVKDNGIGMSPEFASTAFTLFERERTSTASGIQGSGLGLSIVRHIVESMGGSIRLETEQGVGTEFIIELELRTAEEPEREAEPSPQEEKEAVSMEGQRVLLVDDIEVNREIVAMLLEMEGLEVEQACDGSEAVEMVAAAEPGYYGVVLMDIQMPVMNGYDATRAIRGMEGERSKTPIIALSANAFDEDKKQSALAGMNDHLAKPVNAEKLIETLRQILTGH